MEWPALPLRHYLSAIQRQTYGAPRARGLCMIRWSAAIAPQFSAVSVEPRSNPLTNSPSAISCQSVRPQTISAPQAHAATRVEKPLGPQQPLASGRWILGAVAATLLLGRALRLHHLLPAFLAGAVATRLQTVTHYPRHPGLGRTEV